MSKFVNYKKRSVLLPAGCKNLFDVLHPHGPPKHVGKIHTDCVSPNQPPTVTRGESFIGVLSDIDKYVAMAFDSRARSFILMVTPPDEQFTVDVGRMEAMEGLSMRASVFVQTGTEQEKVVRSFFVQRGLHVGKDSGMPPMFVPGVPVQTTYDISPLPSKALLLSQLLADLLRGAFGLSDDSQLCFRYYEIKDAA
jgi:hypothetical protein